MSDDMYRNHVLDHVRHPRRFGSLASPTFSASGVNAGCGDRLDVDVAVGENGVIADVAFRGASCAIATASASLLAELLVGKSIDEALLLRLVDVERLLGTTVPPMRARCASLLLSAVVRGITLWKTDLSSTT